MRSPQRLNYLSTCSYSPETFSNQSELIACSKQVIFKFKCIHPETFRVKADFLSSQKPLAAS